MHIGNSPFLLPPFFGGRGVITFKLWIYLMVCFGAHFVIAKRLLARCFISRLWMFTVLRASFVLCRLLGFYLGTKMMAVGHSCQKSVWLVYTGTRWRKNICSTVSADWCYTTCVSREPIVETFFLSDGYQMGELGGFLLICKCLTLKYRITRVRTTNCETCLWSS